MQHYVVQGFDGDEPLVEKSDQFHLLRVMRARVGDRFVVINEHKRFLCEMKTLEPFRSVRLSLIKESNEPFVAVTAAIALVKPDRFEHAVQKCTEAGVARIIPLITERTNVAHINMARLLRIAKEAAEQSNRDLVPVLTEPVKMSALPGYCAGVVFILSKDSGKWLFEYPVTRAKQLTYVVGPEGGFSDAELENGRALGWMPLKISETILRTETAATAAAILLAWQKT